MKNKNKLLVTTALEKTWGKNEEIIFLGDWCVPYEKEKLIKKRKFNIIKYHWSNKRKKMNDRTEIEKIYFEIFEYLSIKLNKLHDVNENKEYWRTLLFPWLMYYCTIIFDRWENLQNLFKIKKSKNFNQIKINNLDFKIEDFHKDWLSKIYSDEWNHNLYNQIIDYKYSNRVKNIKYLKYFNKNNLKIKRENIFNKYIKNNFYKFLFKLGLMFNKFLIENPYTSRLNLLRLYISTFQLPIFISNNSFLDDNTNSRDFTDIRNKLKFDKNRKNKNIINFIKLNLYHDLPMSIVENFNHFKKNTPSLRKKIIFGTSLFYSNTCFKILVAEAKKNKSKFYLQEHGGSLFQEINTIYDKELLNITDGLINHSLKKKIKNFKLPRLDLLKYIDFKRTSKSNLLIVANETVRYHQKNYHLPTGPENQIEYLEIKSLIKNLSQKIKNKIILRNKKDLGYSLSKKIKKDFSDIRISILNEKKHIDVELKKTKLILCTYPETTISQALASGIPTVIFLSKKIYNNFHEKKIIKILKKNKIFFDDTYKLSYHINSVWNNIDSWWLQKDVVRSREFYLRSFDIKNNWLKEWSNFLKKTLR
tara:strand:- start:144 stop:1910 length:1767 start_codon:yes stop_codon:yes gene_type:complete